MKCFHCQGELVHRTVSYAANRNGYHLIIDDVPAWVCEQCGEPLFDEQTVDAIQGMLREVDSQVEKITLIAVP